MEDKPTTAARVVRTYRTTEMSYSEAYDSLKGTRDPAVLEQAYPKVNKERQARQKGAARIPFSDIYTTGKGREVRAGGLLDVPTKEIPPFAAKMKNRVTCFMRFLAIGGCHAALLVYGPSLWSWKGLGLAYLVYSITGMIGITLGYHRLLTHKSFKTYKAVEYFVAWVGAQSGQGDPIEWVSTHRYHHMHTDTPLDPHSPYEGFWWSHITWLAGTEASFLDYANVPDLKSQLFYRILEATFFLWVFIVKPVIIYQLGGLWSLIWGHYAPLVIGWHATFLVNSACHIWGAQPYDAGDLSTNNAIVAFLAFGEGWHNNHHAFPSSARHGLEKWQLDPTWWLIQALAAVGLAWDIQLPSEKALALKRRVPAAAAPVVVAEPASPPKGARRAAAARRA